MKRICLLFAAALALLLFSAPALADDAGVLTETELGTWLNTLLISTSDKQPLNAPVDEDALTEDGYAFIYDSATLYYDKPVLDAQSVLSAISVTDEALDMPRGIRLGASGQMLISAYAWENPTLAGDDTFAPLYVLNQMPQGAYWALAQRTGDQLISVQCAIHAQAGEDRYTDTGVLYTLQNGVIISIRIYGLSAFTNQAGVQSNLSAVSGISTGFSADAADGVTLVSAAGAFEQSDLQFGRMDFLTLTETGAGVLFSEPANEDWAQDDSGQWLHSLEYEGASLVFSMDANKENPRLESLILNGQGDIGPRGLTIGMSLNDALVLFRSDGTGAVSGSAALLYGDGQTAPFGTLERTGSDATLRYAAAIVSADGVTRQAALHLTFAGGQLAEIMLYTF